MSAARKRKKRYKRTMLFQAISFSGYKCVSEYITLGTLSVAQNGHHNQRDFK